MRNGPHDVSKNTWAPLSKREIDLVYRLDNMDKTVDSHEADFLNQAITKLKEQGEDGATFSAKQRNWIHKMAEKYLRE